MGYLFENMEKMDIQWERQQRADAQKKLQDVLADIEVARADAENARADAENAKKQMLKSYIKLLQEFVSDRNEAKKRIMKEYSLDELTTEKALTLYWK